MMNPVVTYGMGGLQPVYDGAKLDNVPLPFGSYFASGRTLGLYTGSGTDVNDVQTITCSYTPTGGTFNLTYGTAGAYLTVFGIAYNSTSAQAQLKINTALGFGNTADTRGVVCTGGPLPGTPIVVTFSGNEAKAAYHPLMTTTSALSGGTPGTITVAHTTPGCPAGGFFTNYDDTLSDGTQVMRRILKYDCFVSPNGLITFGQFDASAVGGNANRGAPAYYHGDFKVNDSAGTLVLLGLDAAGISDAGRLINATLLTETQAIFAMNGGG